MLCLLDPGMTPQLIDCVLLITKNINTRTNSKQHNYNTAAVKRDVTYSGVTRVGVTRCGKLSPYFSSTKLTTVFSHPPLKR